MSITRKDTEYMMCMIVKGIWFFFFSLFFSSFHMPRSVGIYSAVVFIHQPSCCLADTKGEF